MQIWKQASGGIDMRTLVITATLILTLLSHAAFSADETLHNDGFTSGAPVNFQAGFVAGEVAAARFVPQIACPCLVESITFLFGGSTSTQAMGLSIWEDVAGTDSPGTLLFTGNVSLTGSNVDLQQISLKLTPVVVSGPFRVGLEFGHDGLPSVATDLDGTIDAAENFIFADVGLLFWFQSATLGVDGDFVIRATINNLLGVDTDGDGVADEQDNCINIANVDQRDSNADGIGNACDSDIDNNCSVNFLDQFFYAENLFVPGDLDTDNNGDGVTNFIDFAIFANHFLGAPGPSAEGCD